MHTISACCSLTSHCLHLQGGLVAALSTMQGEAPSQHFMKIMLDKIIEMDTKINMLSQDVNNLSGQVIRLTNENKQLRGWLQQAPRN